MLQCATCGTVASEQSSVCSQCGLALPLNSNGDATGVMGETVAIPAGPPSQPRITSGVSRISHTTTIDEGRFLPGTLIAGRYRVIGLLGRGGMGEVYRATDLALGQSVALKILPEDAATNQQLLERFQGEVRIARQVSHPNVCRVYDLGEADGIPFISMEYVDGEDLASLLHRIGRLPSDKALEIARKLCAGVAAAHERGVIHRDLKPQNIMLNKRGEVIIMDFGLAAVADQLHGAEARNGTPAYMAPEQLRGDSVTAKSDIYALGLIFYELFTGKRAYEASSVAELIRLEEANRPVSMTTLASDIDPGVEKVILRCLQPDPPQRPPTALMVAAALPGGDPLAAALAAGETPSPEMVAASGKTAGFSLRYAVPCLAFALLSLLAYPFLMQPVSTLALSPMEFPPAVLEAKAREMAAAFGYPEKPRDWASFFDIRADYLRYFRNKTPGRKNWRTLFQAEPPVWFIYRQSPFDLASPPDGRIDLDRPAFNVSGMIDLFLDSRGFLRRFQAIAPRLDEESIPPVVPDPGPVFQRAGLDFTKFRDVTPTYTPVLAFDARRAWIGQYPGLPDTPITVEMATWRGKLTSFLIRWPWTAIPKPGQNPETGPNPLWFAFSIVFMASGIFTVILLSRSNLKKSRGDRKGAFRLAAATFLFYCVNWMASQHIIPSAAMLDPLLENLSGAVATAALVWVIYMALEPLVRARWPHSLITWNRLLAGNVGDPRLGSHILMGVVLGMILRSFFLCREYWLLDRGGLPDNGNLFVLNGLSHLISSMADIAMAAIIAGAVIFFLLSGLRALFRYDWLAALAAALLMTFQEGGFRQSPNLYLDFPIYIGTYAALGFALLRMGMVPAIVAIFTINLIGNMPISAEFSSWYNPLTVIPLTVIAAIAIYGFWRSQTISGVGQAATER
jgi:predicted Ser/Thr protein kinase